MSPTLLETRTKFHISLNVKNLSAAVEFYRALFAIEPAKHYDDYAKFEVEEPPVVFSLSPHHVTCGGVLSNIGIQVSDESVLAGMEARLSAAGIASRMQTDALCGYARQIKLWVTDPDDNHWKLYVPGEDVDPSVMPRSVDGAGAKGEPNTEAAPDTVWEHHLSHGPLDRLPHADASLDEVRLQGTFNSPLTDEQRSRMVSEAFRVLRGGGKVVLHGLVADKLFPNGQPALPGLAALVSRVPLEGQPIAALRKAGFVGVQVVKFSPAPVFLHDGVEMREQKLVGWKPAGNMSPEELRQVMYKGPFASVTGENEVVFQRGERTTVPLSTWNLLRESSAAEQFLFLQPHGLPPAIGEGCGCT